MSPALFLYPRFSAALFLHEMQPIAIRNPNSPGA